MKYLVILLLIMTTAATSCSGRRSLETPTTSNYRKTPSGTGPALPDLTDPYTADSIAYHYWGHPESPYRDDDKYLAFLERQLATDTLPEALRLRAVERRRIVLLNRPGTIANDFSFEDRDGETRTLHTTESRKMLMLFYDPLCSHCEEILKAIASDRKINDAVAEGTLTVLAVYAEGNKKLWDSTKRDMPKNWIVGYDLTGILDKELYDLPAMPTIYVLDADGKVLFKDPPVESILSL